MFWCLGVAPSSRGANRRFPSSCRVLGATAPFLAWSVKIDRKASTSTGLKSDTGRYYPVCHSHPWASFVSIRRTRPALEARALRHPAAWFRKGGDTFEDRGSVTSLCQSLPATAGPFSLPPPHPQLSPCRPVPSFARKQTAANTV